MTNHKNTVSENSRKFRCPQCGGCYCSAMIGPEPDCELLGYRCDCDVNGGDLSFWKYDAAGEIVPKTKNERPAAPCGWRGPPEAYLVDWAGGD